MWSGVGQLAGSLGKAGVFGSPTPTPVKDMSYEEAMNSYKSPNTATGVGIAHGGIIPGVAPFEGDTTENDIVPAHLSPGELVIPRSKMSDAESAKAFIDKHFGNKKEPSKHEHLLDLIAELHGNKKKSKE